MIAGHPWIFEKSIQRLSHAPEDGELIQIKDSRKRFIGIGFYNSRCRVRIRVAANKRVTVDQHYFEEYIRSALSHRQRHLPGISAFRVVNAESDYLGGLVVDKYDRLLSIQISSLAFDRRRDLIHGALRNIFPDHEIFEGVDSNFRRFEGLEHIPSPTAQIPPDFDLTLNDLRFLLDFNSHHKTGAYLDQQFNYREVGRLVGQMEQPRVLDCFSYQGGFSLHAAQAGASRVLGLEQSSTAVDRSRHNAIANGFENICHFQCVNVFDWFKSAEFIKFVDDPFDAVILDPPSFTRSRANLPNAARGYKEIHLRALRVLRRGGLLSTFSCSHHVDHDFFLAVILDAARDTGRQLRLILPHSQPLDHPVLPAIPETEYLRGFTFEVL